MRVIWSPEAREDLRAVLAHYAQYSDESADRIADRILKATRQLEMFPYSGRIVPEIQHHNIREIVVSPYRVWYSLDPDAVLITAIFHGAMSLEDE